MKNLLFIVIVTVPLVLVGCSRQNPVTAQELCNKASFAMQEDDHASAASLLRQATELKPDFAEAWVGLGMALVQMNQIAKARSAYECALALHSERYKHTQSTNELQQQAFVLLLLGKPDEAEALLVNGRQTHPNATILQTFADAFPELAKCGVQEWQIPKQ